MALSSSKADLEVGEQSILNTEVGPSNASDHSLTWSIDKPEVASIADDGTLTALSPGVAVVTVQSNADPAKSDTLTVTVDTDTVNVREVSLTPATISDSNLTKGDSFILSYDLIPAEAANKIVNFTTDAPSVATVDSDGLIRAVSGGSATITVTTQDGGYTATCEVNVNPTPDNVPVDSVELGDSPSINLNVGDTKILNADVIPQNATSQDVEWTTSDPLVVSVASDGALTALSPGTATIAVKTENDMTAVKIVTVVEIDKIIKPVESIKLPGTLKLTAGERYTLLSVLNPPDASNKKIYWSSSDPNVVTVDTEGNVVAAGPGTATVSATTEDGAKQGSCVLTVAAGAPQPPIEIDVIPAQLELDIGETQILSYMISPVSAADKNVEWTSAAPYIAAVDGDGLVSAVGSGVTTITASTRDGGVRRSCTVVVTALPAEPVPVDGVAVYPSALALNVGSSRILNALISPDNAMDEKIYWSSDDPSVGIVDSSGWVRALKPGVAKITVTTNDMEKIAVCTVTVSGTGTGEPVKESSGSGCAGVPYGSAVFYLLLPLFFLKGKRFL